jgi:hypothetical protein
LLETVEGFLESEYLVGRDVAAFRWFKVNEFLEFTVEKCGLDVDLITFQIQVVDEGKEHPDRVLVSDSSIELVVVDSFLLEESLGNPPSLVCRRLSGLPIDLAGKDPLGPRWFACRILPVDHGPDFVLIHLT